MPSPYKVFDEAKLPCGDKQKNTGDQHGQECNERRAHLASNQKDTIALVHFRNNPNDANRSDTRKYPKPSWLVRFTSTKSRELFSTRPDVF